MVVSLKVGGPEGPPGLSLDVSDHQQKRYADDYDEECVEECEHPVLLYHQGLSLNQTTKTKSVIAQKIKTSIYVLL